MGRRRKLDGLRILITGASQGIGRALAVRAAARGMRVLAAARNQALLDDLAQEVRAAGGTLETVAADVTGPEDRARIVEAARRAFGGLDVLVNNAGIGATGHFQDAAPDRLRKIMEVNFFGVTETTRVCLPLLKEGQTPAVVNISSIAGKRGIAARSEYSASKFAVQGFSEALRAELAKDGVDVLVVNPGLTQTNFSANMIEQKARIQLDHMRGMSAEQVADATLRCLGRGDNEVTLTFQGRLLLLVAKFLPWVVDRVAKRKVRDLYKDDLARLQAARSGAVQKKEPVGV